MPYTFSVQRRRFLRDALACGGVLFIGETRSLLDALVAQSCEGSPLGDLVGVVPLHGETARATPFGAILGGAGLDARRFTDLSRLEATRLITPSAEVFLRTAAPPDLESRLTAWPLPVETLRRSARPMGAHLIECSGNTDPDNFGLMSVVEWDGVPLVDALSMLNLQPRSGVLISGVDYRESSRSSAAGASWVFSTAALKQTGAFLATRMNGDVLPRDHGAPIRLVVPGWYGCSWIKWVDEIRAVEDNEPVTPQMIEFSLRTHQPSIPNRALDYEPPTIDLAATPIRVEKRRVDGRLYYRVIGIVWGGDRPVDRLAIRFRAGEPAKPFTLCPPPRTHRTWSLWEYRWSPPAPGLYSVALTAVDPGIRTRRLDISFYVRRLFIDEV